MKVVIYALMVIIGIYAVLTYSNVETTIQNRTNQIDQQVIAAMR